MTNTSPVRAASVARRQLDSFVRCEVLPKLDPPAACGAGCSWCCHSVINVSAAEAVAVAMYVTENLSEACRDAIASRLDDYTELLPGKSLDELRAMRRTCPFLFDDVCVVYPARPLICVGYISQDAAVCERSARDPQEPAIHVAVAMARTKILFHALALKSQELGLAPVPVFLVPAVRVILRDPTSAARWGR